MKITEKINFRQPKYMLPAILYFPLLGASYFIFDLFNAEKSEVTDKSMQTTEYLNPELPGAKTKVHPAPIAWMKVIIRHGADTCQSR